MQANRRHLVPGQRAPRERDDQYTICIRRILFIANPAANRGSNRELLAQLRARVSKASDASWIETTRALHATALAREAAANGFKAVAAVGGDGTVHEVVNGLMQVDPHSRPALGVVPVGTGNDFSMGAGVFTKDHAAAVDRVLGSTQCRGLDACSVQNEHRNREYWVNTLGIGFDAAANIEGRRKSILRGFPLYLVAVLRTIANNFHASDIELECDGAASRISAMMFSVGNGPREGGGFLVTPEAKVDDGILDYAVVEQLSRLQMLLLLPRVMNGTHPSSPHVTMGRFRKLHMRMSRALPVHADGEIFSIDQSHHLTIEVHPSALSLVV